MNKVPALLRWCFRKILWHKNRKEKILYITFDDGPNPLATPWVLDTLEKYSAKGTFFCLGENAEKYPELIERIRSMGHTIGSHGYSHMSGWKTSTKKYFENLEKAFSILKTNYYRPPYGRMTLMQYIKTKKKYRIIYWDYLSDDYKAEINLNESFERIIKSVKNGSIIVFHDSEKAFSNIQSLLINTLMHFSGQSFRFHSL
ncbi:MAG: polysaccharide deacetylase family protein [Bacteroidales bacterium]|nr:polysaccharide deacetylase family protein [Bacteroidales bacterium]